MYCYVGCGGTSLSEISSSLDQPARGLGTVLSCCSRYLSLAGAGSRTKGHRVGQAVGDECLQGTWEAHAGY